MKETTQLLDQWRHGDDAALEKVLTMHLPFIRELVRHQLGPVLRQKLTSDDVVQDAVVDFLRNGPRFVPENGRQLQSLLARIVANTICDHGSWFAAVRRRMASETPLATGLDVSAPSNHSDPIEQAHRAEMGDRLRLAMELLPERDRRLVVWRDWEKRSFAAIGEELQLGEEAARAAWRRAVERLREFMARIRQGELGALLAESEPG